MRDGRGGRGGRGGVGGRGDSGRGRGATMPNSRNDDRDFETEMIMGKVVSDKLAVTYLNQNVRFFMWIFDDEEMQILLLAPFCINQLRVAAVDREEATGKNTLGKQLNLFFYLLSVMILTLFQFFLTRSISLFSRYT